MSINKNTVLLLRLAGVLGLVATLVMFLNFSGIESFLKGLYSGFLGHDHPITDLGNLAIHKVVILIIFCTFILSVFLLFLKLIVFVLGKFIDLEKVAGFFLKDEICSKKQPAIYLLIIGAAVGVFYNIFFLTFGQPYKEGFMEDYTELLYVFAVFILLLSLTQINKTKLPFRRKIEIALFLVGMAAVFFILFGEEVSWGQRVIGYESFGVFQKYNYQDEVNFHNFFNPLFVFAYPLAGHSLFIVLIFLWAFEKPDRSYLYNLIIPPRSFFFLVFMMSAATYNGESEIFEEMVSVFSLMYSIRVFFCLRYPIVKSVEQTEASKIQ